jgi:hypothetical protein
MKWLISFLIINLSALGQQVTALNSLSERLKNDREEKSLYLKKWELNLVEKWDGVVSFDQTKEIFNNALSYFNPGNICAFDLSSILVATSKQFGQPKSFLYTLRKNNLIDDVVLNSLLRNFQALQLTISINNENIHDVSESQKKIFLDFENSKNRCIDETFKVWKSKIAIKNQTDRALTIQAAYQHGIINFQSFQKLYRANSVNLDLDYVTLRDYLSKKEDLRKQKPVNPLELTSIITERSPDAKVKIGHRTRLYQKFNLVQIVLLADIIKKLNEHLASPNMNLMIYDKQGNLVRNIELEEMERFRFAIKFLRKEMALLPNNFYFSGQSATYIDLITAAYEVGLINSQDINSVASLEELWNPKKTFYEKAGTWIRLAGSVGTLLIPPPYGFVMALALVAIEATAKKSEKIVSPEHSLF